MIDKNVSDVFKDSLTAKLENSGCDQDYYFDIEDQSCSLDQLKLFKGAVTG